MDKNQAMEQLLDFIVNNYMVEREEVPLDRSLVDEGIIDSFGLIEIASFIEQFFSITIADNELIRENFGSIIKIIDYVERKEAKDA